MKNNIPLIAILASICCSAQATNSFAPLLSQNTSPFCSKPQIEPSDELREILQHEANTLSPAVLNKVMGVLKCVNQYHIDHNNIVTIVDYSLPANQKRLWVFDLEDKKLLFHTYVSHGIKSGALLSTWFSNKYNSKTSSIGVYKTQKTYYGRDGLSLRLDGLDSGFNSNASNRSIVMHGGWYVEENFIKKYGRSGRSWGCPAVPLDLAKPIINTIKDNSLLIAYYPSDDWFAKSKFLRCESFSPVDTAQQDRPIALEIKDDNDKREDVLLTNSKNQENTAVLVISAHNYEQLFNTTPPLGRMLRRQIDNVEYIALSTTEFERILSNYTKTPEQSVTILNEMHLVKPTIKMVRGYYETQMQILNLGKIKEILPSSQIHSYTISFETHNTINVKATDQFIRWLGL